MRKTLSALIAVLIIASLLPTASLAQNTSLHLFDIPVEVTKVTVHWNKNGITQTPLECSPQGTHWTTPDQGEDIRGYITGVTLQWGTGTTAASILIDRQYWDLGQEGQGSGTLNGYLLSSWNITSVSGTKTWEDGNNRDGKRPQTINVKVLDGTREIASQAISSPWTYEFTELPKYRDGLLINYIVDEDPVDGYSKSVNGFNITNTYTPETVTISGTKTWEHGTDPQPPTAITVNVMKGTEIAASATIGSPWTYQFTLPKYENGMPIQYTVEEAPVGNYTPKYTETGSGVDILNTYTPPVTPKGILRLIKSVSGTTAQDTFEFTVDGPNAYHTHVTLHGSAFMDITDLTPGDYTVEEINIPSGYTVGEPNPKTISVAVATGTEPSPITFINTYTPETGSLTVTKVVAGTASPTTPAVYSFSVTGPNGYTDSFTITGENIHTLTGLVPGDYTVTEVVPAGSAFTVDDADKTTTVAANQTAQLTFTNTYTPVDPKFGILTIRKHVEGDGAPAGDEFDFSIQRVQSVGLSSVMAFAPFSLKDGEERTYTNLTPGEYLITETHWPDGYQPESVSKQVTVNAGENPDLIFTNYYKHKDPPTQTYTVSYHPNGGMGTVPVDMNRYYPGDKAWLKSGAGLYRPNCVFDGWSLIDGTRVSNPYIMGRSDVTFFAIWVPVKVPMTGDQPTPYGLIMMSGAVLLAALYLFGKRRHTAK